MNREYCDYVIDLLAPWSDVTVCAMFGGYGVYRQGQIFAIIVDGMLYFKVDDQNLSDYEAADSQPFTYEAKGRTSVTMSYWLVPSEVMEDSDKLNQFAEKSYQAGLRSLKKKRKRKKL